MHVASNRQGGRRSRCHSLAVMWMMAFAVVAHAVEFDEKLKSPVMKNAADLRTQVQAFASKVRDIRAATPAQLVTSASLARQQFDLRWQVLHAIDKRQPLDELAQVGIVSRGDGSYDVDMTKHPEWDDLAQAVIVVVLPDNLENTVVGLTQRGFRPEDVATLRDYIAAHEVGAAAAAAAAPDSLQVVLGFGRAVSKYDKLGVQVPDELVFSYWYQRARIRSEADRAWAVGLLKSFDAQRQRIYLSIAMELKSTAIWSPDDIAAGVPEMLALVRQPDFEQRVIAEAKAIANGKGVAP